MNHFAKNLVYLMNKNQFDVADLSSSINVHPSTISTWVNGTYVPRSNNVAKVAFLFDVTTHDICHKDLTIGDYIPASAKMKRRLEKGSEQINIVLQASVKKELKLIAAEQDVTVSYLIEREMMNYVLNRNKKSKPEREHETVYPVVSAEQIELDQTTDLIEKGASINNKKSSFFSRWFGNNR